MAGEKGSWEKRIVGLAAAHKTGILARLDLRGLANHDYIQEQKHTFQTGRAERSA